MIVSACCATASQTRLTDRENVPVMKSRNYPVIVIGSGPAGLTLVNLLARAQVRYMLVERNATRCRNPEPSRSMTSLCEPSRRLMSLSR